MKRLHRISLIRAIRVIRGQSSFQFISTHRDHASANAARADVVQRVVYPGKFATVRDQVVQTEFLFPVEVQVARDVFVRDAVAAFATGEDFPKVQGQRVGGDVLVEPGDADEDCPALRRRDGVGEFDQLDDAGVFDCDIHPFRSDDLQYLGLEVGLHGIDEMGGAEFSGHVEFMIVDVDGNDRVGGDHGGALHHAGAHAAAAEDGDGLSDLDPRVVVDEAQRGRDRATHERCDLEADVLGNRGEAVFGNDGVFIECGDPAGVHGAPVPLVFRGLRLDARPFSPMEDDVVALFYMQDARPRFEDNAAAFVAEEVGQEFVLSLYAGDLAQLRAADAAAMDFYENLPARERRDFDLVHYEGRVEFFENRRARFHSK